MTATQNANATIKQTINVNTYEQASNYVNEDAARTAAEKSPKDIEVGDIVYANFGYSMTLPVSRSSSPNISSIVGRRQAFS